MTTNPYLNPPEENEQMALAKWLELHKVKFTHVPNEGKHKVQYRVKQKQLGVKPVFRHLDLRSASGLPENVARPLNSSAQGGRVTPEQSAWLCAQR